MEDPHLSYNIFHGNSARDLATPIRSTLKVPDAIPKAKGFVKADTGKKPLCDVGNTLATSRRIVMSMPEPGIKTSLSKSSSFSDLKGLPNSNYQCDEVFSEEANFDQSLDPVPKPTEDNYEDIIPKDKDISVRAIHKMMYLWEQYDIASQSSWELCNVENTVPLPESPLSEHLLTAELFGRMQELPVPSAVPLITF